LCVKCVVNTSVCSGVIGVALRKQYAVAARVRAWSIFGATSLAMCRVDRRAFCVVHAGCLNGASRHGCSGCGTGVHEYPHSQCMRLALQRWPGALNGNGAVSRSSGILVESFATLLPCSSGWNSIFAAPIVLLLLTPNQLEGCCRQPSSLLPYIWFHTWGKQLVGQAKCDRISFQTTAGN
jgi:hypothetical protein